MSQLKFTTLSISAADLGGENPLPNLQQSGDLHAVEADANVPADMIENMKYGRVSNILPYTLQDQYERERHESLFKVAILENEILRATFLLDYGGRLWSLYHKPSERELLSSNPVFQPANLALRNAWFSGGVEWNISTIGHWPLTCAPVFAAQVQADEGKPVLRLYEWERLRQVPFHLDFYLPDGSPLLYVHVRIINPHDHDIAMYWWSNVAVPETPKTRVIVPAEQTYRFGYTRSLDILPVPTFEGVDMTYATNGSRAMDFFFHIPDGQRRWMTALDSKGKGLVQISTDRLKGRKLFLWGMGQGGRRWQEFLSEPGKPYIEIQAGLARTQLEHLKMPARTEWDWLEGYGSLEADPALAHSLDWQTVQQHVSQQIENLTPNFDAEFARSRTIQEIEASEIRHLGSGWGYLEKRRRELAGEAPFASPALAFDESSLTAEQLPWLHLLENGSLPVDFDEDHPSFMVQEDWRGLLERAAKTDTNGHAWLQLGIMDFYAGRTGDAKHAWEQSLAQKRTFLPLRNLAVLAKNEGDLEKAVDYYLQAYALKPELAPLVIELGQTLIDAGKPQQWLDMLNTNLPLPPTPSPLRREGEQNESQVPLYERSEMGRDLGRGSKLLTALRKLGRIRLLEARAALMVEDFERVDRFFADGIVIPDLREGEISLSEFWLQFHAARIRAAENLAPEVDISERVRQEYPIPRNFDFRMSET